MKIELAQYSPVLSVFKMFKKLSIYVSINDHIYSMNTYIYSEYSCEVSVEVALYFELQEKNKFVATYRDIYLSEINLFCIAQI